MNSKIKLASRNDAEVFFIGIYRVILFAFASCTSVVFLYINIALWDNFLTRTKT